MRAFAHRFLAVDDGKLQLVLDRQRIDMRGSRSRRLALQPGKVLHVFLQRIAVRLVAENQLARQIHFFLRNLVQRINLGVVHDGHIEAVVHRLVHEDRIQNPPRISIQPKRNIADAQNRLNVGQFFLDPLDCLQRLDSGAAVLILAGRNRQSQRIENQIRPVQPILLRSQIEDAMRDRHLLLRGQRHAVFVDGQRNHRRAVALRHRQNFRRPLLAIFQIDRIDDRPPGNALQRLFDHVGLGRIDQNRRRNARGNPFQNRSDVSLLVLAHDRAAQIEHVRPVVHQLLRQRQNVVVFLPLHQIPEVLDARRRVHFLGDDQRLRLEIERNGSVSARSRADALHVALRRLDAGNRIDHRFQMLRSRAAASAHDAHAVILAQSACDTPPVRSGVSL